MASRPRLACSAAALALAVAALPAIAADRADNNRTVGSVHQPTVSRTDFVFDAVAGPTGLAPGEPQRLAGWFDGLVLGYGDTVTVGQVGGYEGDRASQAVGAVLSRYGMLLSAQGLPLSIGRPPAGSVRVVVSRAVARVDGCPDWSRGNYAEYGGAAPSNYGCAAAQNLAAMIADPQDLVQGESAGPAASSQVSVKAVATWRDAEPTGKGGLKTVSSKGSN